MFYFFNMLKARVPLVLLYCLVGYFIHYFQFSILLTHF